MCCSVLEDFSNDNTNVALESRPIEHAIQVQRAHNTDIDIDNNSTQHELLTSA